MRPVSKVRSAVSSRGSTRAVRRTVHVLFLFLFVLLFVSRKSSRLVGVIYESTEVLSIDFHISPVRDVELLSRDPRLSHIRIIDKSLSGHCKMMPRVQWIWGFKQRQRPFRDLPKSTQERVLERIQRLLVQNISAPYVTCTSTV